MKTCTPKFLAAVALALAAGSLSAANIVINNIDGAGEGLNDPTVVAPLPSNPAVTLGAQRLAVLEAAAAQWGALLQSNIDIQVNAAFNPLTCSGTSAVLGSAGANTVHRDFANAPVAAVWYAPALASSLANVDVGAAHDINEQFNVSIDAGCLTGTTGWHYSTAISDTTPAGRIPLMPVVFHELAHGLGFQTFTSSSTGAFFSGFPSIWDVFLTDAVTGVAWRDMPSDTARQASAISDPNLIWTGENVRSLLGAYLLGAPQVVVNSPAAIVTTEGVQTASFGPLVPGTGLTGNVVAGTDTGGAGNNLDGCEPLTNAGAVAGNIALIVRGNCNFTVKAINAQTAGAVALMVDNNTTGLPGMGGTDPLVVIPSVGITQALGNNMRAQLALPATVNVTLSYGSALAGTQFSNGRRYMRQNAPNPVQPGSSVSHFTVDAFPNLLMEPAINNSLFSDVDLTIPLFRDIGWRTLEYLPFASDFE